MAEQVAELIGEQRGFRLEQETFHSKLFQGRKVVVTGAGSGIGRATAQLFSDCGARVALLDARLAETVANEIGGEAIGLTVDVRNAAQIESALAEIAVAFGGFDTLVCSAGVLRSGQLASFAEADWDIVMDVNVKGVFRCCKAAVPHLVDAHDGAANGRRSRIVIVSSASAFQPKAGLGAYSMSKAALVTFTRVLSTELAYKGVNVNAVAPGTIRTPMVTALPTDPAKASFKVYGNAPIGRIGEAEDVAQSIGFLCSPAADFITGAILGVDGGTTATFPA